MLEAIGFWLAKAIAELIIFLVIMVVFFAFLGFVVLASRR